MNIDLFKKLGDGIEQRWLAENYNEQALPAIAKAALLEADLPSKTTPWEAIEWALSQRELPPQRDVHGGFAQPPVTLYLGPRFHIDLYFWFTSTTTLHQHAFCGAFQVFEGSSIHSWYEFERDETVNAFCEMGKLDLKVCQILTKGTVQEIWPGRQYIHSLFHLDEPSVTITVRTHRSPLELPQFNYFKPGLAVDPYFEHETSIKQRQLMLAALHARRPNADDLIAKLLDQSDLQTAFGLLSHLRSTLRSDQMDRLFDLGTGKARFERFLGVVEERQGKTASILRPVFEYMDLQSHLVERRHIVTQPDHRFFFALLLNLDDRERILGLLRERYPDEDPVEKILDWVFDLSQTRILGKDNDNALGVRDFGPAEMFVLEGILRGKNGDQIVAEHAGENADVAPETIPDAIQKLRDSLTFRPLMA